jgi:hypothetical protein
MRAGNSSRADDISQQTRPPPPPPLVPPRRPFCCCSRPPPHCGRTGLWRAAVSPEVFTPRQPGFALENKCRVGGGEAAAAHLKDHCGRCGQLRCSASLCPATPPLPMMGCMWRDADVAVLVLWLL